MLWPSFSEPLSSHLLCVIYRQLEVCGTLLGSFFFSSYLSHLVFAIFSNTVFCIACVNLIAFSTISAQHSVLITTTTFSPRLISPTSLDPPSPSILPSSFLPWPDPVPERYAVGSLRATETTQMCNPRNMSIQATGRFISLLCISRLLVDIMIVSKLPRF